MTVEDELILVNEQDEILGYDTKAACHRANGRLHRAFSVLLFNDRHELLVQQRSAEKPLWPMHWSNSVCSHPRRGEQYEDAVARRVKEELGVNAPVAFAFRFCYHAAFRDVGAEHELCSVYVGRLDGQPIQPNPAEIAEWKFMTAAQLDHALARHPEQYTPWFRLEWAQMRTHLPTYSGEH